MGGRCQIGPLNILQNLQNKLLPQTVQTLWNDLEGLSPVKSKALILWYVRLSEDKGHEKSDMPCRVWYINIIYVYVHLLLAITWKFHLRSCLLMKGTSSMQCNLEDCYFSWTFFSDVFQVSGEPQSSLHPRDGRHRKDAAQARRSKEVGAGMYVTGRLPCNFQAESKSREPQTLLSLLIRVITIPQLAFELPPDCCQLEKCHPSRRRSWLTTAGGTTGTAWRS